MTYLPPSKAIPVIRDLISLTFAEYGDSDPFNAVPRVREFFSSNPEFIKKALAEKGVLFDDKIPVEFIEKEISDFLAVLVMQPVNRFIDNTDFDFLNPFSNSGAVSSDFIRKRIYFIFKNSFNFSEAHVLLKSSCNIFQYNVLNRYLIEIFSQQNNVSGLLKKEISESFSIQELIDFVGTVFLVRPMVYTKMSSCYHLPLDYENMGEFIKWAGKDFSPLPERIIEEGFKSFLPGPNIDTYGYLPGLIAVLDFMCRIQPQQAEYNKAEESIEKSWLAIAMVNADYFSFDKNIIEGLYLIAGDKKW